MNLYTEKEWLTKRAYGVNSALLNLYTKDKFQSEPYVSSEAAYKVCIWKAPYAKRTCQIIAKLHLLVEIIQYLKMW